MNKTTEFFRISMRLRKIPILIFLIAASVQAQTPAPPGNNRSDTTPLSGLLERFRLSLAAAGVHPTPPTSRPNTSVPSNVSLMPMAAGPNLQVFGSGTSGRLTKWTGQTSTSSSIGDSTIFEDKFGNVGIGTDSPTSKLTVAGTIQASGGSSVVHDPTLTGNGTSASPLGVAIPLILTGAVGKSVVVVTNTRDVGTGISSKGGNSGDGVEGFGGDSDDHPGTGVTGIGGKGDGAGGTGVSGAGGTSTSSFGGDGVSGVGGDSPSHGAGTGVRAEGGNSAGNEGGIGLVAAGGTGLKGGNALLASRGLGTNTNGKAAEFIGDVVIVGNLDASGTKNFRIDHPLDPENKYLVHAAIESSEVLNLYSGNTKLDSNGEAIVHLPEWFQAINRDFRYSLTPIGASAGNLYIAEEIADNRFKIAGGKPGLKISWQVTGVRSDPAMLKHEFKVEQDKDDRERGHYLDPAAYNQPEEQGTEWARYPEMMRQMKMRREKQLENARQRVGANER